MFFHSNIFSLRKLMINSGKGQTGIILLKVSLECNLLNPWNVISNYKLT
ncbi:hypothetical protein FHW36_103421 [Chitinophaga polysaccharea]|uniref:Uncharacterized protein n=1 Tax=Chitinophaga polysaccharea TaxID=1293035 RepID=A0A561PU44_9BACT|nr:hypothetical protein FHW36_103421 [Chitinophaga polysaccharea]